MLLGLFCISQFVWSCLYMVIMACCVIKRAKQCKCLYEWLRFQFKMDCVSLKNMRVKGVNV